MKSTLSITVLWSWPGLANLSNMFKWYELYFQGCDKGNIQMLYGSIIHSVFQQVPLLIFLLGRGIGMGRSNLISIKGFYSTIKLNFKDQKFVTIIYTSKGFKKTDVWRKPNSHRGRKHNETEQIYTWHVSMWAYFYCSC